VIPWYCGQCSRWNPEGYLVCPTCRRPRAGRLCLTCKEAVPSDAACCPRCTGTRLTEPGAGRTPVAVRVGLGVALLAFVSALPGLLAPLAFRLWAEALGIVGVVLVYAGVFWVVTGLMPAPLGRSLRRGGARLARSAFRLLGRLFRG
jgi:hypothetical protein